MRSRFLGLFLSLTLASSAQAQLPLGGPAPEPDLDPPMREPEPPARRGGDEPVVPQAKPFGSALFEGAVTTLRDDGINADYRVVPGDRVGVNAWGAYQVSDVFIVDTQGNIFLPEIGPIALMGVRNADLNEHVRSAIARVYRRNVEVYTNLLNASPVAVYVTGRVVRPGRYAGLPSDSPLFFLHQAGGVEPLTGSYRDVKILREGALVAEVDLYDFLLHGNLPSIDLRDGDTILVGKRGPTIEVDGAVARPTLIELKRGETQGSALLEIAPVSARSTEVTLRGIRRGEPMVVTVRVSDLPQHDLRDGDVLEFREEQRTEHVVVHLEGEFRGSTTLSVRRGARLIDLLDHLAVNPEIANTAGIHIRRPLVARQQKESLERSLERLERSTMLALSSSAGESQIRLREAELMRQFIASARTIEPLGRVVVRNEDGLMNILLQEGDVIVLPPRTNVVQVSGEIQIPSALMYSPGMTARSVITRAGGFTRRAATNGVLVIRPSAEIVIGKLDLPIYPGDEVLVMPAVDRKIFQNAIDITQVLYHIAVAASVVLRVR
jgi:protein involved in polysaccharide export with SLBB domain